MNNRRLNQAAAVRCNSVTAGASRVRSVRTGRSGSIIALVASLVLCAGQSGDVQASGGHLGSATNARWQEECGACHLAFPPQLLGAASWQAVMDGLKDHFGTDASLESAASAEITTFLLRNARRYEGRRAAGQPLLRVTETPWFRGEHDELTPATWSDPAVGSAANCEACHTRAAKGDYSESSIQVPHQLSYEE